MLFEERNAYGVAIEKARCELKDIDPEARAIERAIDFDLSSAVFSIPLLGSVINVSYPDGNVCEEGREVTGAVAVIALHYITYTGKPVNRSGWLAYRDLPGARQFSYTFEEMSERKIAKRFAFDLEGLQKSSKFLDFKNHEVGDFSIEVKALPRVPILLVVWKASEEQTGEAKILFHPSAPFYLHPEDLAVLGILFAERLIIHAG